MRCFRVGQVSKEPLMELSGNLTGTGLRDTMDLEQSWEAKSIFKLMKRWTGGWKFLHPNLQKKWQHVKINMHYVKNT